MLSFAMVAVLPYFSSAAGAASSDSVAADAAASCSSDPHLHHVPAVETAGHNRLPDCLLHCRVFATRHRLADWWVVRREGDALFRRGHSSSAAGVVGHYRLRKLLGAGGMGEVYEAIDERTNRKVALKLLPDYFNDDPQRVHRFEHEARALLALNHPNIVTTYEVGEVDGVSFIASEFIEGETLRDGALSRRRLGCPGSAYIQRSR